MSSRFARSFSSLAWANLAAQSAEQLCLAAVPIVAVLLLGAGPGQVGALATAQSLPFLLLSIPLGLLADRYSRRGLMVWSEAARNSQEERRCSAITDSSPSEDPSSCS